MTTPLVAPKGVSHTAIRVSDLSRSIDFYTRLCGFDIFTDTRGGDGPQAVIGIVAGHALELIDTPEAAGTKAVREALGHCVLALTVDDIDATHAALHEAGLIGPEPPATFGAARMIFVRDPDGVVLEFIELPRKAASLAEIAERIKARAAREALEAASPQA